jgi:tetratricopeptide (TPR) repeat protein
LAPDDPEIVRKMGYIYQLLGQVEEAEEYLRKAIRLEPDRQSNYLNLADLLGREGASKEELGEAAKLLAKARGNNSNQHVVILKQARVARLQGADDEAENFYNNYLSKKVPGNRLNLEIGDFYRDMGRAEDALSWYRQVEDGEEFGRRAARRIWEIEVENQARKFRWAKDPEAIPAKARILARKGRALLNQAKFDEAKRILNEAIVLAPAFAMAHADLGSLFREIGELEKAEIAYLKALALDSNNAEICVRLGQLYLAMEDEVRAVEAALFLNRALDLRPDWLNLHFNLAKALRVSGDLDGALRHLNKFLSVVTQEEEKNKAMALKRTIEELRTSTGQTFISEEEEHTSSPSMEGALSDELTAALHKARSHLAEGRLDAAMAELKMFPNERQSVIVLNLEARILHASGKIAEAAELLHASLEIDSDQVQIREQLGTIFLEQGKVDEAREHFLKAESLGDSSAFFLLVKMAIEELGRDSQSWYQDLLNLGKLLKVRSQLDTFLNHGSTSIYLKEARVLSEQITDRVQSVLIALGVVASTLLLGLLFVFMRIRGENELADLVSRHPEAGPDVQRVLSAIRHEILKHNTMVIGAVVEALERGEDAPGKKRHFLESFFGSDKGEALVDKLEVYADELTKIGRAHGVRLNLKRKDPALSVLFRGFGMLEKIAVPLDRLEELKEKDRKKVLKIVSRVSDMLNVEGYQAVQKLLDQIRSLDVDMDMLKSIAEKVSREASFATLDVAPVLIESQVQLPFSVLIAYQAFEDIMANLIRNALQSSSMSNASPIEVGISVQEETDSITGFERAVFLISDRSFQPLTTEILREQGRDGGLGLTRDLIARYDGTVDVVPGGNKWVKSVRVRLPMAPVNME